jgi:hypothetical protein
MRPWRRIMSDVWAETDCRGDPALGELLRTLSYSKRRFRTTVHDVVVKLFGPDRGV